MPQKKTKKPYNIVVFIISILNLIFVLPQIFDSSALPDVFGENTWSILGLCQQDLDCGKGCEEVAKMCQGHYLFGAVILCIVFLLASFIFTLFIDKRFAEAKKALIYKYITIASLIFLIIWAFMQLRFFILFLQNGLVILIIIFAYIIPLLSLFINPALISPNFIVEVSDLQRLLTLVAAISCIIGGSVIAKYFLKRKN